MKEIIEWAMVSPMLIVLSVCAYGIVSVLFTAITKRIKDYRENNFDWETPVGIIVIIIFCIGVWGANLLGWVK